MEHPITLAALVLINASARYPPFPFLTELGIGVLTDDSSCVPGWMHTFPSVSPPMVALHNRFQRTLFLFPFFSPIATPPQPILANCRRLDSTLQCAFLPSADSRRCCSGSIPTGVSYRPRTLAFLFIYPPEGIWTRPASVSGFCFEMRLPIYWGRASSGSTPPYPGTFLEMLYIALVT